MVVSREINISLSPASALSTYLFLDTQSLERRDSGEKQITDRRGLDYSDYDRLVSDEVNLISVE